MGQNINEINSTKPEDIEAVNILVKEIARAIRENTVNCDRTFKTVVKRVTSKGYVILDESGSERTVGCCIPNITLYTGQMVWVKIPMGDIKRMYICNTSTGKSTSSNPMDKNEILDYCNQKFASKTDIPTKNSELINDSNYIKNTTEDLVNYYKKTEVYTKNEINSMMEGISDIEIEMEDINFSNYFEE